MAMTYRVVHIIVPNRTARKAKATLAISKTDRTKLNGLAFKGDALEIGRFGLTTELCGDVKRARLKQRLTIELQPFADVGVRAVIQTNLPAKGKAAVAVFAVTDTRGRAVTGGVTIVCTSPEYPAKLPSAPDPANPCPLALAADLVAVDPGADPRSSKSPRVIGTVNPQDLVAAIENRGPKTVNNAKIWLEHMDVSGVTSEPKVWHIGTVEPGGQFWATWNVDGRGAIPGKWEASFVAQSDEYEPIRLRAGFTVLPRNR